MLTSCELLAISYAASCGAFARVEGCVAPRQGYGGEAPTKKKHLAFARVEGGLPDYRGGGDEGARGSLHDAVTDRPHARTEARRKAVKADSDRHGGDGGSARGAEALRQRGSGGRAPSVICNSVPLTLSEPLTGLS